MPKNDVLSKMTAGHVRPAWVALPNANVVAQDPNTVNSTAAGANATVTFATPFCIIYDKTVATSSAQINTDIYTVPTGFKLQILDAIVVKTVEAESSSNITLRNNTTDIFTKIASATDAAVTRPTAGFSDATWTLTAGQKLNVLSSDGSDGPAVRVTVWACLLPA